VLSAKRLEYDGIVTKRACAYWWLSEGEGGGTLEESGLSATSSFMASIIKSDTVSSYSLSLDSDIV